MLSKIILSVMVIGSHMLIMSQGYDIYDKYGVNKLGELRPAYGYNPYDYARARCDVIQRTSDKIINTGNALLERTSNRNHRSSELENYTGFAFAEICGEGYLKRLEKLHSDLLKLQIEKDSLEYSLYTTMEMLKKSQTFNREILDSLRMASYLIYLADSAYDYQSVKVDSLNSVIKMSEK